MTRYERALSYATQKHEGQYRKGGQGYITHPVGVAELVREKGYGEDFQITALFHDLLEDTNATEEEIERIGGTEVLKAVKLLTKTKGYVMKDYISAIKRNEIAFVVKGADRLHNLRCAIVTDEDFKEKYVKETMTWYLDFDERIFLAVKELARSMTKRMEEYPVLYED